MSEHKPLADEEIEKFLHFGAHTPMIMSAETQARMIITLAECTRLRAQIALFKSLARSTVSVLDLFRGPELLLRVKRRLPPMSWAIVDATFEAAAAIVEAGLHNPDPEAPAATTEANDGP